MTGPELEYLKSRIGQFVEIETRNGEHILAKPICVFDDESDPDVFFWDATSDPEIKDSDRTQGWALHLSEIVSVKAPD